MKRKPKISVIMTVYNAEKYLSETIDSILNQSFKDFELIAVNDKSADKSLNVIKEYMKKDKRIILINNRKNFGPTTSLNIGLKIARGKYIAISDHDDVSLSNRLLEEYNFLEKNKDIFLVGSGAININEKGIKLSTFHPITNTEKIKNILPKNPCIYHPTIMFRNEKGIKYRDKIYYAHDRDFYLNLLSKGKKITNIPNILVEYRIHSKQLSTLKRGQQYLFSEKAKEFYQQRQKYGKDKYNSFDPNEILKFDVDECKDKQIMQVLIDSNIKIGNLTELRKRIKEYFLYYGYLNKFLIYYFMSFLNEKNFNRIRKILVYLYNLMSFE